MAKLEIKGLDNLTRQLDELQRAVSSLDGDITTLKFNPHDQYDIDRAIRDTEQAVDSRLAPYGNNPSVQGIAAGLKQKLRAHIIERADEARNSSGPRATGRGAKEEPL